MRPAARVRGRLLGLSRGVVLACELNVHAFTMNYNARTLSLRRGRCFSLRRSWRFSLRRGRRFPARFGMSLTLAVFALCVCVLAPGCERARDSEPGVAVEFHLAPQPPRAGTATITLTVTDAAGHPVSGAMVKVEGDMSHPGMSPVFGQAMESGPGRYRADIEFTMAGDWVVLTHLTLPDGRKVERQFDVKGVRQGVDDVSD
jgi:YtkA-like